MRTSFINVFPHYVEFWYLNHLQRCDQFSAELFRVNSIPRQVPVLCNSTVLTNSTQTSQAANNFCSKLWTTCQNVSMMNSPFSPSVQGQPGGGAISNITKWADIWKSESDFCNAFGGASEDDSVCFAGEPVTLNSTGISIPPSGLCLEKIGNGSYLNMVAHPDGSNRAFFSNQPGKIWLATIPKQGSGDVMQLDEANPFLDLSDEVTFDTEFGMMGIAVHPNFLTNGRFFVSFNCDKTKWPACGGRCACNSDVNCDPSKLPPDGGSLPCQYQSVVAEFTVNGTASRPSLVLSQTQLCFLPITLLLEDLTRFHAFFFRQNLPNHQKLDGYLPWVSPLHLITQARFFLDQQMDICIS